MTSLYPPGTVLVLLESDLVTPATRRALQDRLQTPAIVEPRFFDAAAFETLCAVCDRLIPQSERPRPIDLAGTFDARLADMQPFGGGGDGWRFAIMPPDRIMHVAGLEGIEQTSAAMFDRAYTAIGETQADEVLRAVQSGTATGSVWTEMDAGRYFEELLAQIVDIYYSHPLASEEIGYVGMADAHGWQALGLGARELHEPVASAPVEPSREIAA